MVSTINPVPSELKKASLKCRLGFHKWSTWGDSYKIPDAVFEFSFQERSCLDCGFVQKRHF